MQQNYGFHEVPLNVLPDIGGSEGTKDTPNASINMTKSPQAGNTTLQRPFSKSLSVASVSSVNCPPNELLANLDGELCLMALEHILTLAASQCMLALKNPNLPAREKNLIRREISSELLSYQEFVRRKVLVDYREHNKIWHRRKHGQVLMQQIEEKETPSTSAGMTAQLSASELNRKPSSDLRVNVVRRLHLQQQQQTASGTTGNFEMSRVISPIVSKTQNQQQSQQPTASTPTLTRPALRRSLETTNTDTTKRVHISDNITEIENEPLEEESEEIVYFAPEEPKYSPLSYIQFVEEDYLHFMSNLFFIICQHD